MKNFHALFVAVLIFFMTQGFFSFVFPPLSFPNYDLRGVNRQTVFKTVSATRNLSDYLSMVLRVGLEPTIFRVSDECLDRLSFRRIFCPTDRIRTYIISGKNRKHCSFMLRWSSESSGTRTCTKLFLKQLSLPFGLYSHCRSHRIRTYTYTVLNRVPLPVGLRSH